MPTKKEIKETLEDHEIEFDSRANKDELESKLPSENTDSALTVAKNALEQIAAQGQRYGHLGHDEVVITSVGKAAQVAQDALDEIND